MSRSDACDPIGLRSSFQQTCNGLTMASVRLIPIDGPRPDSGSTDQVLNRVMGEKAKCEKQMHSQCMPHAVIDGHKERHVRNLEWLANYIQQSRRHSRVSNSPVDLRVAYQIGNGRLQSATFDAEFATRHLVRSGLLYEHLYDLRNQNKVFCSQWLSSGRASGDSIILGTKCNTVSPLSCFRTFRD